MFGFRSQFATGSDPRLLELSERLGEFYESIPEPGASCEPVVTDQEPLWRHIRADLSHRLRTHPTCRVLEFGAGRTGFARRLGEMRRQVHFVAQDISRQHEEFLRQEADTVHIGPVETLKTKDPFDAIFSGRVFEHLTHPKAMLDRCLSLLRPGGKLYICCPRYDYPFRLSPSADHYGTLRWTALALALVAARVRTWLTGYPGFWIHLDPAILHLDWQPDRDAIHWASYGDIRAYARGQYPLRPLPLEKPHHLRAWIRHHLRTMAFAIEKPLLEQVKEPAEAVPLAVPASWATG